MMQALLGRLRRRLRGLRRRLWRLARIRRVRLILLCALCLSGPKPLSLLNVPALSSAQLHDMMVMPAACAVAMRPCIGCWWL